MFHVKPPTFLGGGFFNEVGVTKKSALPDSLQTNT